MRLITGARIVFNTRLLSHVRPKPSLERGLHTSLKTMAAAVNIEQISKPLPVVGVVQMTSGNDKEANWLQGKALVERASSLGAQMIFLPECFDYVGTSRAESIEMSDTDEGVILTRYRQLAKKLGVWLSLGGMHEKVRSIIEHTMKIEKPKECFDGKRLYNTHFVINSSGDIAGRYSKTHLFDVDITGGVRLKETDFTLPGPDIGPPVITPVGAVGLAICYDMRFAELSTILTQQGADILTYPSAFTVPTGMAHWESLLRARAIENQCCVIAAAQVGKHNEKRSSYGHSMIVDPWGCILAECPGQVGVCVAEIDIEYLKKRRREMPVQSHRRHDLYGQIVVNSKVAVNSQDEYQFGHVRIKNTNVFHRTPLTYAFVNVKPVLAGHVLIATIRPVERFTDLTATEISDLFLTVQQVSKVIEKHYGGKALTIAVQDGEDAGQTVKHVHVHILPRKPGDFQQNDDIYDKLEHHDKNVNKRELRTEEEMTKEATELRSYFT